MSRGRRQEFLQGHDPSADHSSLRESILEHTFLGSLGRELWRRGQYSVEVLRAEVDRAGYDVVISVGDLTRYIQLKSLSKGATTREWSISNLLTKKTGGCVVVQSVDRFSLDVEEYLSSAAAQQNRCPTSPRPSRLGASHSTRRGSDRCARTTGAYARAVS